MDIANDGNLEWKHENVGIRNAIELSRFTIQELVNDQMEQIRGNRVWLTAPALHD